METTDFTINSVQMTSGNKIYVQLPTTMDREKRRARIQENVANLKTQINEPTIQKPRVIVRRVPVDFSKNNFFD